MILPFGQHKFKNISDKTIPDTYLKLLADGFKFPSLPGQKNFQVSFEIRMAARQELKMRGYKKVGLRWEL